MAEQCPNPRIDCKYFGTIACILTRHHEKYPKSAYPTKVEKAYRNLPENIKLLPNCDHERLHHETLPPEKPTLDVMRQAIADSALSKTVEPLHYPVLNVFELDDYRDCGRL